MAKMLFIVKKDNITYDMTNLVSSVTWSGRRGSAARNLNISLIDDPGYQHDRSGIDCEQGHQCGFYWEDQELFQGIIMKTSHNNKKMTVNAYDAGIYLSNNKDTFNYSNMTATQIFQDCMSRLGLAVEQAADTGYVIAELPKPKTTYWDVICDALSTTYKSTGKRFYVVCMKGKFSLIERKAQTLQWVLETGGNIIDYSYSKSIENTRTRIRLLGENDTILAEKSNAELEQKIGVFQEIDSPKDTMNEAQLDELANSMLEEKGHPVQNISLNAAGIPDAYSGKCVYVQIKDMGIERTFYIDSDSHTFDQNKHTMNLTLNYNANIASIE